MNKKNRNKRADIAQETLKIISRGEYQLKNKTIDMWLEVKKTNSKLIKPDDFELLLNGVEKDLAQKKHDVDLSVVNCTTLEGAQELLNDEYRVGVLNFASAKNPGGGFLGGAQAQEESIARSSTLYPSIVDMTEMYEYNKSRRTYLYSDYMIYTENVVVFRDDEMNLLEKPYVVDVLTSPAVNVGAIKQNKPREMQDVEAVMMSRIDKVLAVFVSRNIEYLVLGAWGCGVFQNDPKDITSYFHHYLGRGGKYEKAFKKILFAVLDQNDRGTYRTFKTLEDEKST